MALLRGAGNHRPADLNELLIRITAFAGKSFVQCVIPAGPYRRGLVFITLSRNRHEPSQSATARLHSSAGRRRREAAALEPWKSVSRIAAAFRVPAAACAHTLAPAAACEKPRAPVSAALMISHTSESATPEPHLKFDPLVFTSFVPDFRQSNFFSGRKRIFCPQSTRFAP